MKLSRLLFLALCLCCLSASLFAQNGIGSGRTAAGQSGSARMEGMDPWITNPPGAASVGNPCIGLSFDFDATDPEGDPYVFGLSSGPGTLDSFTGMWSWSNVISADVGSYIVKVHVREIPNGTWSLDYWLNVTVNPLPDLQLTTTCHQATTLTDFLYQNRLRTNHDGCNDHAWTVTQTYGPPTGASCTINDTGRVSFYADMPGMYEYRFEVSDGSHTDSCSNFYTVHGGGICCIGTRGNVNNEGGVDLSDLSQMISYMTIYHSTVIGCYFEADLSADGNVDLSDLSLLISYMTVPGSVILPNCP